MSWRLDWEEEISISQVGVGGSAVWIGTLMQLNPRQIHFSV